MPELFTREHKLGSRLRLVRHFSSGHRPGEFAIAREWSGASCVKVAWESGPDEDPFGYYMDRFEVVGYERGPW